MRIALVAPLEEPVPPEKYGGTELVVFNLAEQLVRLGHDVYLLATGDSKTTANLVPILAQAIRKENYADDASVREAMKYIGLGRILHEINKLDVDVVHNHLGWRLLPFKELISSSMVTTIHSPPNKPYLKIVLENYKDYSYVSISNFQASLLPGINYAGNVYNGVDLGLFGFSERAGEHLVFLSRISAEKGAKEAIEIAKRAGRKLIMAGKIDAADKEYFEVQIKPYIDGKNVEYIGEIETNKKREFLSGAYALLAPIQWHEPFGLFLVEAMACGTPVITTKMGATSEIVVDGETGFVVDNDMDVFVEAVEKVDKINRKKCYDRAKYFSVEKMTEGYLEIYKKVIKDAEK